MSKFPGALPLDRKVIQSRFRRRKDLLLAAKRGVAFRGVIIIVELFGFSFWGSWALLLDALSGMFDVLSSLVLIWCIRKADEPPDESHPLGHGRFEPIAGLLIGFSLVFLGVFTGFDQIKAMVKGTFDGTIEPIAWIIPFFALILLEICHQILKNTATRRHSPALMADAYHYRIDALTSFFALIALGFAAFFPYFASYFDRFGALSIAFFMIIVGINAFQKNIHQLLDQSPPKEMFEKVHQAAMKVKGVLGTEKCLIQVYGPDAHVSLDIEVDPASSVEASHELTQQVRREIQIELPMVRDVIVHVEPYYPGDHS